MLHVLDVNEQVANDPERDRNFLPNIKFMSDTSLVAWRLVINSSIGLIDELIAAEFNIVLTGRFNYDPIEVIWNFLVITILKLWN